MCNKPAKQTFKKKIMERSKSNDRNRRPTSYSSTASSGTSRSKSCSRSSSNYGRNSPLFVTSKSVNSEELDHIVNRITRPTVASRGGVDLRNKDFTYITPKPQKTRIVVPGLERRYMGIQKVNQKEMDDIVERMSRMTKAYESKYGPDKNVWFDQSPQAKFIRSRSAKV